MKTIIATVGAVMTAVTLGAQEADEKSADDEEEESSIFEAGVDFDFYSAYVWRNAVQTDRMVMQPCVWADFTLLDPFWFGFNIWQNYDLTSRRSEALRRGLTETDYNIHAGVTAWASEDGEMSLEFEVGHEWFYNQFVRGDQLEDFPDSREIYLKATFANPLVDIYGQVSWMYGDFGCYKQGLHYEVGLTKEIELVEDTLTFGADWNVNFGDAHYLEYLYGNVNISEDEESWDSPEDVIGGTTIKAYLSWALTDWMSLKGTLAYTAILNGEVRQQGRGDGSETIDFFWGGLSLNFAF